MAKHLLTSSNNAYHYNTEQAGYYQFVKLKDIINYFMVAYVGEDKLISKVQRLDVYFHAQRALQELSYDTLRSHKAQELVVSPGLKVPVPPDFVNYNKLAWVDNAGIEHVIYPTDKTSNPQFKGNLIDYEDSHLSYDASGYTFTADTDGDNFYYVNNNSRSGGAIAGGEVNASGTATSTLNVGAQLKIKVPNLKMGRTYLIRWRCNPLSQNQLDNGTVTGKFKVVLYGDQGHKSTAGYKLGTRDYTPYSTTTYDGSTEVNLTANHSTYQATTDTDENTLMFEVVDESWTATIDNIVVTEVIPYNNSHDDTNTSILNLYGGPHDSTTWDNYKSTTPSENNNDDYEDDTYWPMHGERYGLDPQHAQVNGSFYISEGFIYFSSNLSGKTVILKYISDSLGATSELAVHKFAEEAMYKWIMHAILSTRANISEGQIRRLKKERFAEVRKAKLRLSNIKLEEITQVLRGKSKQIKH